MAIEDKAKETVIGRVIKDLSGFGWFMERMRIGQGVEEGIQDLPNELSGNDFSWNVACVPGDVYTDLYNAGEIDDPHYGRNMGRAKWVQDYEWWYTHSFNITEDMAGKNITLVFEGIDYSCEVWFNTQYLGKHEGMMSSFKFDITDLVDEDVQHIPTNKILIKLDPPPKNQKNFAGLKHNFAGDYLTGVIPFGIWKPIKVIATEKVRIDNYRLETKVNDNNADVSFELDITGFDTTRRHLTAQFILNDGELSHMCEKEIVVGIDDHTFVAAMSIENANLWWPYELGEPFLYDLNIKILDGDKVLDNYSEKVGLREVEMEMNPGFCEDEVELPWTFVINGKQMFMRSACWGGQPSFFYGRNNESKYRFYLEKAKEANINNLRIFGWHPAETEEFYQICDELGITVWTNFSFATQVFRDDQLYIDKVCHEVSEIVKDRRNHASTVMWMGGEEVYFSEAHVHSNNRKLMETIGKVTKSLTNAPYGDASPLSSKHGIRMGYKPKESVHANAHYYAAGAIFMEDYYPNLDVCIIPELTAASSPNVESLKKFIPENELWPMGLSWGYHAADTHILQILNYEVFGDKCMDSLEQFVEATQVAQGTIFQFSLEHFRRCKPHVSGVALCHFITNWPIIKWDVIDYYGEEKKSFDFVKKAYQPLLPSMKFVKRRYMPGETFEPSLWVINDYYKEYKNVTYNYEILSVKGKSLLKGDFKIDINENSSVEFESLKWEVVGDIGQSFDVKISIVDEQGEMLSKNYYRLLIANQEEAIDEAKKMYMKMHDMRNQYGRGYYRYTPELLDNN